MYNGFERFLPLSDNERTLQVAQSRVVVTSRNVTKLVARFNMFESLVVSFVCLDFSHGLLFFVGRLSKTEEPFSG